jgi:heat shock protein HtpX
MVTAFSAWLLWSWSGVIITLTWIAGLYLLAPRVPPEMVMRMYSAVKLDPRRGDPLTQMVATLSQRAELTAVPDVYIIPSTTLNAFATGQPDKAVIGLTEGLLRRLDANELAGVLAHEISHVRNNDLAVLPGAVPVLLQSASHPRGPGRHLPAGPGPALPGAQHQ